MAGSEGGASAAASMDPDAATDLLLLDVPHRTVPGIDTQVRTVVDSPRLPPAASSEIDCSSMDFTFFRSSRSVGPRFKDGAAFPLLLLPQQVVLRTEIKHLSPITVQAFHAQVLTATPSTQESIYC